MTFRLKDVRPKTGHTTRLDYRGNSYSDIPRTRKTWKPTSVITRRKNAKAIDALRRYVSSSE